MTIEVVCGVNPVQALLERSAGRVKFVYFLKDKKNKRLREISELSAKNKIASKSCDTGEFESLLSQYDVAAETVHQGVIALFSAMEPFDEKWLLSLVDKTPAPFILALDGITDPHNLGACLRSACAAGVDAVIVPKDRSAQLNPTVRKVASGAAELTPVVVVKNLSRCLQQLQKKNVWVMGAAGEASQSIYELDLKGGLVIVMGAEAEGLRRLTRETCDHLFAIPMRGAVESLNVSVAAGVCLFEANRQRSL